MARHDILIIRNRVSSGLGVYKLNANLKCHQLHVKITTSQRALSVRRSVPPYASPHLTYRLMTSKVLYFERLPSHWTERDLAQALAPVEIAKCVILRKRNALFTSFSPTTLEITTNSANQALVEVADIDTAVRVVEALEAKPLTVAEDESHNSSSSSMTITASYSKNQELHERQQPTTRGRHHHHHRGRHNDAEKANRILLVTVQNPTYPVTTDLVHSIFKGYGTVEKVVIFVKPIGLQVGSCVVVTIVSCVEMLTHGPL